jgi:Ca-activated chloride channel family protein
MKTLFRFFLVFGFVLVTTGVAHAIGRVYARWPNDPNSPIYNLRIKSMTASVTIRDQLAVTYVDQEFANDNSFRLEGFYVFVLPEGARVNEMYLWINGQPVPYVVKKLEDAVVKYTEIVTKMRDPAILEQLGPNTFRLQIFPFDAHNTRRIAIQYSQPLTYYTGTIQYTFPLDMRDYTSAPIETAGLVINLSSQLPITSVETTADEYPAAVNVTRIDSCHYKIEYGVENVAFSKDFKVRCAIDRGSKSMLALTYREPGAGSEAPYFLLWSAAPDSIASDSAKGRELTFVADVSSSMEGLRLQQTRDALLSFIDMLRDEDRFNIISFSTTTVPFRPDLVNATTAARDSARGFVQKLTALGLTNFEAALRTALQQGYTFDASRAEVIFLTDGQPSWGETRPDSLLAWTRIWNSRELSIYPIGVGEETDYSLLQSLATLNHGVFTPIAADDSIYLKVKDLYRVLFLPKIRNVGFDFGTIGPYDVFPQPVPDIHAGDQLLMAGRFTTPGVSHVQMSGDVESTPALFSQDILFTDTDTSMLAVARYWGAKKIENLLSLIALLGEKEELVNQVIALSIKYSVLTPYTAFLVVEPTSGSSTGVEEGGNPPTRFALLQNYPNPFNPFTTLTYQLPVICRVELKIFDMLGREVQTLVADVQGPGVYHVLWDGRDSRGHPVASGMYICRLTAGAFQSTRTMLLMR